MDFKEKIKQIKPFIISTLTISSVILLIGTAHKWCKFRNIFSLDRVSVSGCYVLTEKDVVQKIDPIIKGKAIQNIPLKKAQKKLVEMPYIKTANVIKSFPSRIHIQIFERSPLSYFIVNGKNHMIDQNGILLPVPDNSLNKNLPIISGHPIDSLPQPGEKISDSNILSSVKLIAEIKSNVPGIYSKISDLHYRENKSDYVLYLNSNTKILLGHNNLQKKLNALLHFTQQLPNDILLAKYKYLDLRWKKQIVVKEKRT